MDFANLRRPKAPNTALYADPTDTPSDADAPAVRLDVPPSEAIAGSSLVISSY